MRFRDILIYAMAGAIMLPAQQTAAVPVPPQASKMVDAQPKGTLKINVLEGEGQRNSIRNRTAVAPVVEVKDASDKAVVGAEVVFQLPLAGPGGIFNGWLRSQTVRTDENGKATVTGYTPNTEAGRFNMKVTATAGSQTGTSVISQINVDGTATPASATGSATPAPGVPSGLKKSIPWKIVAPIIAAAAIGGIAAGLRGNNSSTTTVPTPVSISTGAVTVGVPR